MAENLPFDMPRRRRLLPEYAGKLQIKIMGNEIDLVLEEKGREKKFRLVAAVSLVD